MIDLNQDIADLLSSIATVRPAFPHKGSTFPMISLTEINNSSNLILSGTERLSDVAYQIDVWDTPENGNTREQCEQLSIQVSAKMISAGFKRDTAKFIDDPSGLHRKMMQFSGAADNENKKVYRRGF